MTNLIKNEKIELYYLSLYDKSELNYILEQENIQRKKEGKQLISLEEIKNKEVIISKKNNIINGYSITTLNLDSNKDVSVIIERLYETNKNNTFLHNELFEASIFVAVEKIQLMKNNNNEIPKIISSTLMVNGKEVKFDIKSEYIRRHLDNKFNKEAVKQKIEQDEQFKKERKEVEDKVSANTFYNEFGHRFHSNVNDKTKELSVISNDYDPLSLDERLVFLQQENLDNNKKLDDIYMDFEKEKINVELANPDTYNHKEIKELDEKHKDLITAAAMSDNTDKFTIDVENRIAFDGNNEKIDLKTKEEASRKLGNDIEILASSGCSKEQIENVLRKDNVEWRNLSSEDKEKIFKTYCVVDNNIAKDNINERNIDINNRNELDPKVKKLVLKNEEAAFISYTLIAFISGLCAGVIVTLLWMFLGK